MSGKLIALEYVPDQIFSNKVIGDGLAIVPDRGMLYSPIDGIVTHISKSGHTISIKHEMFEAFIHIGINSLQASKEIFDLKVSIGQEVNLGQELIEFNIDRLNNEVKSIITPTIFRGLDIGEYIYFPIDANVKAKEVNKIQIHGDVLNIKK